MGLDLDCCGVPSSLVCAFIVQSKKYKPPRAPLRGPSFLLLLDLLALGFSQVWSQTCDDQEGAEGQQLLFHLHGHGRGD